MKEQHRTQHLASTSGGSKRHTAVAAYQRGERHWAQGKLRSAFRLFLSAAKGGVVPAFKLVGYFYHDGIGVKADQNAALYWYRRAYRPESSSAANNIGVIWRERKRLERAISWFKQAIRLGDGDANLNIAKIYLRDKRNPQKAMRYLRETCKAPCVTDGSVEEARRLLRQLRRRKPQGRLGSSTRRRTDS